jgi:hypothetical protein
VVLKNPALLVKTLRQTGFLEKLFGRSPLIHVCGQEPFFEKRGGAFGRYIR